MYHRNGAPMERALLQSCRFLSYRGPDSGHFWMDGPIDWVTQCSDTRESLGERQPAISMGGFGLRGCTPRWRAEFIAELERSGRD